MDASGVILNPFKALVLGSSPSRPISRDFRRHPATSGNRGKILENPYENSIPSVGDVQGDSGAAR